jgi:hypothetical protein
MKKQTVTWMIVLALSGGYSLACDSTSEQEPDSSLSDVRKESAEAVDSMGAFAETQRAEMEARAEHAVDQLANEIGEAQEALAAMPGDVREETKDSLEAAIERAEEAQKTAAAEIEASQRATQQQWTTAKTRLASAINELSEARREIATALRGETSKSSSPG